MATISPSEQMARAYWERANNPETICILDPILGNIEIDVLLLIAPFEYLDGRENEKRRVLAIKQGAFRPSPESEQERNTQITD